MILELFLDKNETVQIVVDFDANDQKIKGIVSASEWSEILYYEHDCTSFVETRFKNDKDFKRILLKKALDKYFVTKNQF